MTKTSLLHFDNTLKSTPFAILFTLLLTILLQGCKEKPSLWPESGLSKEATTFELNLADTSLILVEENGLYRIAEFNDSLIRSKDIISYQEPKSKLIKELPFTIDQQVVHSKDTNSIEFYSFQDGNVNLVGFATRDSLKPLSIFDDPLIILPSINTKASTTISYMHTWNKIENSFEKGSKTKSKIQLVKTGKMLVQNNVEQFYLYNLSLSQDAIMNYGEQDLIIPEAVLLKSNLLYGKKSGLILEWGIRARAIEEKEENTKPEIETYLELNIYK